MSAFTPDNPYLRQIGLAGLLHNLADVEGMLKGTDPLRLEAIQQQATNTRESATWGLQALGQLIVAAAPNREVEEGVWMGIGYLTLFLAQISEACVTYEDQARHYRHEAAPDRPVNTADRGDHT